MTATSVNVRLGAIAAARSGDKGSSANIGVVPRTSSAFQFLREYLTPERVLAYFAPLEPTGIRYHVFPKIECLNFVLEGILAGGGSRSLRIDAQGKALGQAMLEMPIDVPADLLGELVPHHSMKRPEV
ncbi:hypothetical protein K2X85_08125 [bacterium]|jgi:hypothetical protein|nr:hypothetical protein [bacterium]